MPPSDTFRCRAALKRTYQLVTVDADAFGDRALHAIQALYDLHAVESGPVQRLAALYARLLGARWLREQRYTLWEASAAPTAAQVRPLPWYYRCGTPRTDLLLSAQLVEAIYAVYVVERLGICHPQRVELLNLLERSPPLYSAKVRVIGRLAARGALLQCANRFARGDQDLLGWDPAVGGPPASDESSSVYERFTDALFLWYYTNYLSQPIGYSLLQVGGVVLRCEMCSSRSQGACRAIHVGTAPAIPPGHLPLQESRRVVSVCIRWPAHLDRVASHGAHGLWSSAVRART
jgi:hypothetical protein